MVGRERKGIPSLVLNHVLNVPSHVFFLYPEKQFFFVFHVIYMILYFEKGNFYKSLKVLHYPYLFYLIIVFECLTFLL